MPTRRQESEQKTFRPDAYSSSVELERGVLGNLVAARCGCLSDPEEITMLWWLQQVSWRAGGLDKFAEALLDNNRQRVGTKSMHRFGMRTGQIYNAEQVRAVRSELMGSYGHNRFFSQEEFPLKGEMKPADDHSFLLGGRTVEQERADKEEAKHYPSSYPAAAFLEACDMRVSQLAQHLSEAITNPASPSLRAGLWNMPTLWDALKEQRTREIEAAVAGHVETEVSRAVFEELEFALQSRSFVLIEGREGIGKSEATRNWCDRHPGQAVYIRLECGSDETTLYRTIATRIGTACSYGRTAVDMRARIQDALQPGHLMVVIDEAHFLWPQSERSERTAPKRVDWLRTALIDFDVPVALVSTPQYFNQVCEKFRRSGWNANQIKRRLAHVTVLPDDPKDECVRSVARHYFPEASAAELKLLVGVAKSTPGFLATLVHLRKRVDFLRNRQPDKKASALLLEAISYYVPAARNIEASADNEPRAVARSGHSRAPAAPVHTRGNGSPMLSDQTSAEEALTVS